MKYLSFIFKFFLLFNLLSLLKAFLIIDETKNIYYNNRIKRKFVDNSSEEDGKNLIASLLTSKKRGNEFLYLPWDWFESFFYQ
ncbi:Hypothetical protein SRAE_X000168200 [Strongyloides ratti]|uniref:Uncharacterized protein n=1 Tax=Strongyloides ratti TaxID=34506 RepID=A0A090KRD1_STRRB|nr:Hypothetical protein SRAE_X000168200 [Strongyloides ratti]CEF59939.1 Hypothetical protein SRAE_X000168200 [Strongyloides ratti]